MFQTTNQIRYYPARQVFCESIHIGAQPWGALKKHMFEITVERMFGYYVSMFFPHNSQVIDTGEKPFIVHEFRKTNSVGTLIFQPLSFGDHRGFHSRGAPVIIHLNLGIIHQKSSKIILFTMPYFRLGYPFK